MSEEIAFRELSIEKNSRTERLPGKRAAVKRGVVPHTSKQRVLAAISKLRSAFFTGYKNKFCTYYILLASERSERDTLWSVQLKIADIYN